MSQSDVVNFPPRGKGQRSGAVRQNNGKRVRDAIAETKSNESFLNQLREMVSGPFQRVSEARFEEMLDILAEQDDFARGKFSVIEAGLEDVTTEQVFLRQKYDELNEKVEAIILKADAEKEATHAAFEEALAKLREEFEMKASILSDTLKKSLKDSERETHRALQNLSSSVKNNREESTRLFEQAQSSSLNSLEARIAQWRAEIEDERKEDMGEVAASLMEIGKRLMSQREPKI